MHTEYARIALEQSSSCFFTPFVNLSRINAQVQRPPIPPFADFKRLESLTRRVPEKLIYGNCSVEPGNFITIVRLEVILGMS